MYRLNKYLLYHNFFISTCSVALVLYFSLVTKTKVSVLIYCLTFFGTLCVYNLFRIYPSIKDYFKHRSSFSFELILYSLLLCVIFYLLLPIKFKLIYLLPIALSLAYKFPVIDKKDLRSIPYLKVFIIAIVWILIGSIPVIYNVEHVGSREIILTIISQILFFIAITIPFDVFDVKKDKMKTLATSMGTSKAILIAKSCLILHIILAMYKDSSFKEIIGHIIIGSIAFIILSFHKRLHNRGLQYYCVDGIIILQTLIIYFLH